VNGGLQLCGTDTQVKLQSILGQHSTEDTKKVLLKVGKRLSTERTRHAMYFKVTWAGHTARMGEMRDAYRGLVGKPEGRRPLGRPRLK
jgi:hypothetical protein